MEGAGGGGSGSRGRNRNVGPHHNHRPQIREETSWDGHRPPEGIALSALHEDDTASVAGCGRLDSSKKIEYYKKRVA